MPYYLLYTALTFINTAYVPARVSVIASVVIDFAVFFLLRAGCAPTSRTTSSRHTSTGSSNMYAAVALFLSESPFVTLFFHSLLAGSLPSALLQPRRLSALERRSARVHPQGVRCVNVAVFAIPMSSVRLFGSGFYTSCSCRDGARLEQPPQRLLQPHC